MYNDQEASHVLKLTQNVAAVFAKGKRFADSLEVEEMKQLKSNVQVYNVSSNPNVFLPGSVSIFIHLIYPFFLRGGCIGAYCYCEKLAVYDNGRRRT